MNEQSKANEWEFWDYDVSALSAFHHRSNDEPNTEHCSCKNRPKTIHILPSHVEVVDSSRYDEDDEVEKAWREFDSYESILHSASMSNQNHAEEEQQVMSDEKTRPQDYTVKIEETAKSSSTHGGTKKNLGYCRDKSPSPRLNDIVSNCKGARAA